MSQMSGYVIYITKKEDKDKPEKCPVCYRMTMVDGECTRCGATDTRKSHFVVL